MRLEERYRRALLGVAGCEQCSACQRVAEGIVGSPWRPLDEELYVIATERPDESTLSALRSSEEAS